MNADGTGVRRLTRNHLEEDLPAWSPEGRKIAFTRWRTPGSDSDTAIYVMNSDGSAQRRLTAPRDYTDADWSPDGRRIAFADRIGDGKIYLMKTDGSRIRVLIRNARTPDWSPDGRRIAFAHYPAIYVMKADGTSQQRIAPHSGQPLFSRGENFSPDWSPIR
jgi:Tol biopolymer transport system component